MISGVCESERMSKHRWSKHKDQQTLTAKTTIYYVVWTEHTVIRGVNVNQGTSAMMTQDTDTRYTDSRQEVRGSRGGCSTANQDRTPLTKMEHFEMTMFMLEEP